jgi:hypothetical protein
MLIGSSSNTGDATYFNKLFEINAKFKEINRRRLENKDYGGKVSSIIVFPISIYEEEEHNLEIYHQYKVIERFKNYDNQIEYCLNLNLLINPLDVQRLSIENLKQLYCDLIIENLDNIDVKMPKNFDFLALKDDFLKIVEDFRDIQITLCQKDII